MKSNLEKIRTRLSEHEAEAALLSFLPDVRWACGFSGSNALLIVQPDAAHFLTDGRYGAQAQREVTGADIHVPGYDLLEHVKEEQLFDKTRTVLFQSDHTTVARLDEMKEQFPDITWRPAKAFLSEAVASKTKDEIGKIHAAQRITDSVFEHLMGFIEPGMTERAVAAEITYQHLRRGAEKVAFEPIVASGPNGALPHARPTDRRIQRGEMVIIDMGGFLDGYASDMTRTLAVGPPSEEARRGYELVRTAQARALDAARAGMTGKALDRVARDVIEEGGHGEHFPHSLGHGVGLQVHEWPSVSYRREHVLPEGATVTIEPGIYVPERFGIRIEDIVVLRAGGCDNLTAAPKELIVL